MTDKRWKAYQKAYQERYRNKPVSGAAPYWTRKNWQDIKCFVNSVTQKAMPKSPQRP